MTSFLYDNVKSRSTIPHNNLFEGIERFHLIWFDFHFIWFFNLFEDQQIRFSGTPCKPPGSRSQCYLLRRHRILLYNKIYWSVVAKVYVCRKNKLNCKRCKPMWLILSITAERKWKKSSYNVDLRKWLCVELTIIRFFWMITKQVVHYKI